MVLFSLDDIYIKMYVYVFQILNQTFIINELVIKIKAINLK
jgi:hypothetical protein